jgi:uncharacterized membrane protein
MHTPASGLKRPVSPATGEPMSEPQPPAPGAEAPPPPGDAAPRLVRGHPVSPEALMALVQYYRAEVARGDRWRQRMDTTINWALGTAAATMSVAFSHPEVPPLIIPLGGTIVFLLMCIEGRRYRFYDVWRSRTRLLEAHLFVPYLLPDQALLQGRWREQLAEDLILPAYKMPLWFAIGTRLRRNYIWLFLVLLVAWAVRVMMNVDAERFYQGHVTRLDAFYEALRFGLIAPWMLITVVALFYGGLFAWILATGHADDPDAFVYKRLRGRGSAWPL